MPFLVHRGKSFAARRQRQGIEEPAEGVGGKLQGLTAMASWWTLPGRKGNGHGTLTESWALHSGFYVQGACCLECLFHQSRYFCLACHHVPHTRGRHSKNICQGQQPKDPWDSSPSLDLGESKACSHCPWSREPVSFSGVITPGNPLKAQQQ